MDELEYLLDTIDETMQPYLSSAEYRSKQRKINDEIEDFRRTLTEAQKEHLNRLLNQISDTDAEFAANAYIYGIKHGDSIRARITG